MTRHNMLVVIQNWEQIYGNIYYSNYDLDPTLINQI